MADHFDDDPSFWIDRPTGRSDRTDRTGRTTGFERTREHKVVPRRAAPPPAVFYDQADFADDDSADEGAWDRFGTSEVDPWVEPARPSAVGVDPRLMRIGALAAAAVVLIPVVVAIAADDGGSSDGVRSEVVVSSAATTLAPPLSEITAAPNRVVEITAAARAESTLAPQPSEEEDAAAAVLGDKGSPQAVSDEAGQAQGDSDAASQQAAAVEAVEAEADEPECAGTYVVVAGDYWLRFVDSSGATLDEWLVANDAGPETQMYVGDELCIPAGAEAPEPLATTTAAPETTATAEDTAAPETAAPDTTTPETTTAPETTAVRVPSDPPPDAGPYTTAAPDPTPVPTAAPVPPPTIPQGAPSTEGLCGSLPTSNGSTGAGPAEVEAIIREVWPDDIEVRALCIAKREANLRPDLNNWCCYGVFALYFTYVPADLKAQYGVDEPADLWNARTNIEIAYQIYLRGGWDPWSQTDPGTG